MVIAQQEAPGYWGISIRVGSHISLFDTGSGHVLLAFRSPEERAMMIREEAPGGDGRAPAAEFLARLDQVRDRGYEMMSSLQTAGVYNLAAPVLGPDGRAIAALSVPYITLVNAPAAPDITQTVALILRTAEKLSRLAGSDVKQSARRGEMILDTHLHIIDRAALRYPWLAGAPALDRDFLYAAYAREAEAGGISGTLHMEVDVHPDDIAAETAYVAALSEATLLQGCIASCRPEASGFAAELERALGDPFVKGFRRVLHVVPDEVSQSAVFRENVRRLGGTGRPFDLCVLARQLPLAVALADAAPEVAFVLDHCGVPDIAGGAEEPWRRHVSELARRPNVVAKISGVVAYAGADWTVETLRPWVEHVIGAFGWDRVVWGSDWPVCTLGGGLTRWIHATQALIAGASAEERGKLLAGNARRVWRV